MSAHSATDRSSSERQQGSPIGRIASILFLLVTVALTLALVSPKAAGIRGILSQVFAVDSTQLYWYITRAAGVIAYLLLWLSTAWGLVLPTKILDGWLDRTFSFDFHQFISLLSIGFILLHIFVLTADRYMPYTLAQIFIPFLSPYRPVWVGIGVIAFYLTLLVSITFYLRQRIGMTAFRTIHYTSLLAYFGSTIHGLLAGTDSSLPMALYMYLGSFLVIFFLTAYWLVSIWLRKSAANALQPEPVQAEIAHSRSAKRRLSR
jgi:methionine sulfoxide reductase heme-binding subunit